MESSTRSSRPLVFLVSAARSRRLAVRTFAISAAPFERRRYLDAEAAVAAAGTVEAGAYADVSKTRFDAVRL